MSKEFHSTTESLDQHHDTDTEVPHERDSGPGATGWAELLAQYQKDFHVSEAEATEQLEWMQEHVGNPGARTQASQRQPAFLAAILKILAYIKNHPTSTAIYAVLHIWDERLLDDINRHRTQSEFAEDIGLDKAAVNNAVMDAQRHFKTRPRRDQRPEEAKEKMAHARISRLEGGTGKT